MTTSSDAPRRRASGKRDAVVAVLAGTGEFASAQEIHSELRGPEARVGLATVYRVLQALHDDGEVDTLRSESGELTYRLCSDSHHHHLVCRVCGRTVEVRGPAVERWADLTAAEHGFRDVSHVVEIFGTCSDH